MHIAEISQNRNGMKSKFSVHKCSLNIFGLFVSEEKLFQGYIWLVFSSPRISWCIFIGFEPSMSEPSAKMFLSRQLSSVSIHHFMPLQILERKVSGRKVSGRSVDFWPLVAY